MTVWSREGGCPRRAALCACAGALATAALTACSSQKLDTDKLEARLKTGTQRILGIPIRSVQCPDDIALEKGDTFYCSAISTRGGRSRIRVRQVDGEGNVHYVVPA